MTRQSGALIVLSALVSFLLGLVAAGTRPPGTPGEESMRPKPDVAAPLVVDVAPPRIPTPVETATLAPGPGVIDFSSVAARVNESVVSVETAARGLSSEDRPRPSRRRYATDDADAPREGSGSGFIIDPAGYVLTNHHVITGADRVTVTLADGRPYRAEVIGVDPALDVALLHVRATGPLRAARLAGAESLRVGEWVCAIGNPLGVYVHSVTVGVVSYLGRKLFDQGLDAFIQTDAAISFGSSGGPLINARGEVVGITTAVSAQAMNIGFAIPIGQVLAVLPQLRERGSVARGYLGAGLATLSPELRKALGVGPPHGVVVQEVIADTPAERAGLRLYDVILGFDGQSVESHDDLMRLIASRQPGSLATVDVWRDGGPRQLQAKLGLREVTEPRGATRGGDAQRVGRSGTTLGITVRDLDDGLMSRLRIPSRLQGVLVSDVDPAGPGRLAQVRINQVILEVNRRVVRSAADFQAFTRGLKPGEPAALLLYDRTSSQRILATVLPDSD